VRDCLLRLEVCFAKHYSYRMHTVRKYLKRLRFIQQDSMTNAWALGTVGVTSPVPACVGMSAHVCGQLVPAQAQQHRW